MLPTRDSGCKDSKKRAHDQNMKGQNATKAEKEMLA